MSRIQSSPCYHPCYRPPWSHHHPSPRLLGFGLVTLLLPVLLAAYSNIAARVNLEKLKSSRWHSSAGDPPMARIVKVTVLLMTWDACVLWPLLPFGPYFLPFPPPLALSATLALFCSLNTSGMFPPQGLCTNCLSAWEDLLQI